MQNKKINNTIQLKNWLLNKPMLFMLSFFTLSTVLCLIYALIQTVFNIETVRPMLAVFGISFIVCTWYVIKKLPHEKVNQNDFIAITNGATLISVITSFISMLIVGLYGKSFAPDLMLFYLSHKTLFLVLFVILGLFSLYLVGVAICNIYAKYKRAESLGVSPWKIILSMPFAFLLMWTPGYLIKGKDIKGNLQIKSSWYNNLNKWVQTGYSNILFTFLILILCKGIIAGMPTFILSLALLVIYVLWYLKHKSDFIKNINNGYAMTAVGINIAILIAVIVGILGK